MVFHDNLVVLVHLAAVTKCHKLGSRTDIHCSQSWSLGIPRTKNWPVHRGLSDEGPLPGSWVDILPLIPHMVKGSLIPLS